MSYYSTISLIAFTEICNMNPDSCKYEKAALVKLLRIFPAFLSHTEHLQK